MTSARAPRVLLTTEGTYPFHGGGVSTWCDALIANLPEVEYSLLAVAMHPYVQQHYTLPPNVGRLITVPLWGTEEPAEYSWDTSFSELLRRRWSTTADVIEGEFVPAFAAFLDLALQGSGDIDDLSGAMMRLHEWFSRHDYHYALLTLDAWKCFQQVISSLRARGALDVPEPTYAELAEALRLLYRFLLVLNVETPSADVVHSTAAGFCGIPCVIARLKQGTPYLLTEHGVYLREQYLNLRRHVASPFVRALLYRLMESVVRLNYAAADQVSPVCDYNARWEKWLGVPASRIEVIHNGVDPARFTPAETREPGDPRIASVGLIYPLKGQLDLIEAAAIVAARRGDVRFDIFGSASDDEYYAECLQRTRERALERTVHFRGTTSTPWTVYQQADVVVLPSISEAFPYAVIEAMLCGAAIVATDVGGVAEALSGCGVLVRPGRAEDMAGAILALLDDPAGRRRLGAAARARALERFTLQTLLDGYRASYARLVTTAAAA
jgi:glycosyltransferase involved in cell wall biosynthesis